jgi:hypothetical protein
MDGFERLEGSRYRKEMGRCLYEAMCLPWEGKER